MYIAVVTLLMLVLPSLSVLIEALLGTPLAAVALVAKWFVFWGVGLRLGIAGVRQIARPELTARMLGIAHDDAHLVIRELGFANLGIGLVAIASLAVPGWVLAAAASGAVFYALAGLQHLRHTPRDRDQDVAMVSDLGIAALLAAVLALSAVKVG
ncbi:MAG: DUF6790 family protein [Myxococcota bacterium]